MSATSSVKTLTAATTGTLVSSGACSLSGVNFTPAASGNVITIYDNAAGDNSGTIIYKTITTSVDTINARLPNIEVKYGVSVIMTGATSNVCIYGNGLG